MPDLHVVALIYRLRRRNLLLAFGFERIVKAGRPWASSWSKLFRRAVQLRFNVSMHPKC